MIERWLPVAGFAGRYEVSDQGRLRSLRFRGNGAPRIMKATPNWNGYLVVTLGKAPRRQYRLHVLVLEAFVGPRPAPEMDGCHGDGDKNNCRLDNLRWDTKAGNIADRESYDGELNPNAKLTDAEAREVARRRHAGELLRVLADEFGITTTRVSQLAKAHP